MEFLENGQEDSAWKNICNTIFKFKKGFMDKRIWGDKVMRKKLKKLMFLFMAPID